MRSGCDRSPRSPGSSAVDVLNKGVSKKPKDVVLVHGPTPDGAGVNVLRARKEGLELGTMRPLEHGRPIHGEVVKLTPRTEMPMLYDVETTLPAPEQSGAGTDAKQAPEALVDRAAASGPAQVASDSYRKNWDAIWKRPAKRLSN
jgi:hypothetical protein